MIDKILRILLKKNSSTEKEDAYQYAEKEDYNYPSLQLTFDLVVERFKSQVDRLNALDQKASFSLTTATGFVSAGLALQSLLLPHSHSVCAPLIPGVLYSLPTFIKRALPVLPLLFSYFFVILTGYQAYKTYKIDEVPKPRSLIEHLSEPEYYTKASILKAMIEAYDENAKKLDKKAILINKAFLFLMFEVAALVILLTYQSVC